MKFSRKRNQFIIFFIDLLILVFSLYLTLWIRNGSEFSFSLFLNHVPHFLIFWTTYLISMYTFGLYSIDSSFVSLKFSIFLFLSSTFALLVGIGYFYITYKTNIRPKTILVLSTVFSYFFIIIWRIFYDHIARKSNKKVKYLIIGYNKTVLDIIKASFLNNYINFLPVGLYTSKKNEIPAEILDKITIIENTNDLDSFIKENDIRVFVLPLEASHSPEIIKILFKAMENKAIFYNTAEFYELLFRKIPLGAINESWFLQKINLQGKVIFNLTKRLFDILMSAFILLLTIIFWPIIAIIIKAESKGPVFFTQTREGKNGKLFKLYKFRTMKTEQNNYAPTTEKDNRITKFGNFMRVTRIDELPQMLNVLKGNMSLIGPRPERPELACELEKEIPFYRQRLIVKPGITGWDQVSGEYHSPSMEDTYKKLQFDLYYIKNQSIFLDISIFFKTIMTVFLKLGR